MGLTPSSPSIKMYRGFRFTSREKAGYVYLVGYFHQLPSSPYNLTPVPELRHSVVVDVSGEADDERMAGTELTSGRDIFDGRGEARQRGNAGFREWHRSELVSCKFLGRLPFPALDNPDSHLIDPL